MEKYNLEQLLAGEIALAEQSTIRFAGVQVPMIQRDYAQGRKSEAAVRNRFLTALFDALLGGRPLTLDFVYGSVQKLDDQSYFVPLDGQQRLTTLFLLHWYIGNCELTGDERNDQQARLRRFSYATRSTARDFCENLTAVVLEPAAEPSSAIRNLAWFYRSYEQDPTVQAMLGMLDAIWKKYRACGVTTLFPALAGLKFYVLPLDGFGLSDELYIKMNARGKQLTGFENFKADLLNWLGAEDNSSRAEFEQPTMLNGQQMPYHLAFATKLDTSWTDLFWGLGFRSTMLDAAYLRFWNRFLAARYLVEPEATARLAEPLTDLDKGQERAEYTGFSQYQPLFAKPGTIAAAERLLDGLVAHHAAIHAAVAATWGEQATDWHVLARPISQRQRILFLALMLYLDRPGFDEVALRRWLRVVWNLSIDPDVRSAEAMISVMRVVAKLGVGSPSIYSFLASDECAVIAQPEGSFVSRQLSEERQKARLILADEAWEDALVASEKHGLFRGNVGFLLLDAPSLPEFQRRAAVASSLFSARGAQQNLGEEHLLLRAVISQAPDWDWLQKLNLEDSEDNWRLLLRRNDVVRAFVGQLTELATEEIMGQMLPALVKQPSRLKAPASHLVQQVRLVHEHLYQSADLQRWMQDGYIGATGLKWKQDHIYAYRYFGREHTRVMLDTHRNQIANDLIELLGFTTEQRCGNSTCFWGDWLTLHRPDGQWTVTAQFDPWHTLRIGVVRSGASALEVNELVTDAEQDDYWLVRKNYPYATVTSEQQVIALVQTIQQEIIDGEFLQARIVMPASVEAV
ncbi:hypothetical protein GCM10027048_31790 [Hymenobacter coalescens]